MQRNSLLALALLVLVTGCVPTIHGIVSDDKLVYDEALVGAFANNDGMWTFTKKGDKKYKLKYVKSDEETGLFTASLVKIGDHRYLDLYPDDETIKAAGFYKFHLMPLHTFYRAEISDNGVTLTSMDPEWMGDLLKENPDALPYIKKNDVTVISAQTAKLQEFIQKHQDNEEAWGDPGLLKRQ